MLTLLKNMNHLSHMQIYFAVVCAAIFFFFKGISVGCSNPQTHKPPEWKHKDRLVCADKEQKQRDPAISLHPRFPSLSLFIVSSSVITSASSLFPFLLIHNSYVAQIRRVVLAQQPAIRHSGTVCSRKFNTRFDAFIFTSAAMISLSLNLWMPNIPKSAAALNPPQRLLFLCNRN